MSLYSAAARIQDILQAAGGISPDGEVVDGAAWNETERALASAMPALEERAEAVALCALDQESYAAQAKEEARRLQQLAERHAKVGERLRDYLKRSLEMAGLRKLERPFATISIRRNPPSVTVPDDAVVPPAFLAEPKPPPPDRKKILEAWKADPASVAAFARVEQKDRVDIR